MQRFVMQTLICIKILIIRTNFRLRYYRREVSMKERITRCSVMTSVPIYPGIRYLTILISLTSTVVCCYNLQSARKTGSAVGDVSTLWEMWPTTLTRCSKEGLKKIRLILQQKIPVRVSLPSSEPLLILIRAAIPSMGRFVMKVPIN